MRHKLGLFSQPYSEDDLNNLNIGRYLDFVIREPRGESKALVTIRNGTTIREVLKACLRELDILDDAMPCNENVEAIAHIQNAILSLDHREQDRKQRGVEGFHLP